MKIQEIRIGDGPEAMKGNTVTIRYDGMLNKGEKFQEGLIYTFTIGKREVIAGLEYGVQGMRMGGQRKISISPHLAYRDAGVADKIPPKAKLHFVVDLLDVKQ